MSYKQWMGIWRFFVDFHAYCLMIDGCWFPIKFPHLQGAKEALQVVAWRQGPCGLSLGGEVSHKVAIVQPTNQPTNQPTDQASKQTTNLSNQPTNQPTNQ